jgi:hypothetical protein
MFSNQPQKSTLDERTNIKVTQGINSMLSGGSPSRVPRGNGYNSYNYNYNSSYSGSIYPTMYTSGSGSSLPATSITTPYGSETRVEYGMGFR